MNIFDDPELFDLGCEGYSADVEFYCAEALRAGGPCLELGCGTGRLLIPMARAGVTITGLDISQAMLGRARAKVERLPSSVRDRVELREGDMRSFSAERKYPLVIVPFRGFLDLLEPRDQLAVLTNIRRHLLPDGRLVLNFFEPSRLVAELLGAEATRGLLRRSGRSFVMPETKHTLFEWVSITGDFLNQRVTRQLVYDDVDPTGRVMTRLYRTIESRFVFRSEFEHLAQRCGFEVSELFGSFDRGPVHASGELIWILTPRPGRNDLS